MHGSPGIDVEPTVPEGGTLEVEVTSDVDEVHISIPGQGVVTLTPTDGRVELPLPPDVRGGTKIIVTDGKLPSPSTAVVTVTSSQPP